MKKEERVNNPREYFEMTSEEKTYFDNAMRAKGFHKKITGYGPYGIYWCWVSNSNYNHKLPRATSANVLKVWQKVYALNGKAALKRTDDLDNTGFDEPSIF